MPKQKYKTMHLQFSTWLNSVCVCVCVSVCTRACARARVVHACVCVCVCGACVHAGGFRG